MNRAPLTLSPSAFLIAVSVSALLAGCGEHSGGYSTPRNNAMIALNVPTSADPFLATQLQHGAELAVMEHNARGLSVGGARVTLSLKTYDDNGQPQTAAANVQSAIHDGAVAVIEDGIGAKTSAPMSSQAGTPEIIIGNGEVGLVDPQIAPSLFRLSLGNDGAGTVLGSYIAAKSATVAIIHDDSQNGRDAAGQLRDALSTASIVAKPVIEIAAGSGSVDTQIAQVAQAHPAAIAIEGGDLFIGHVVSAIRAAGLGTPLYAGPFGEFPAVRTAAGAAADGLAFVSSRLTSESDATSFPAFEKRLADAGLGCTDTGLHTSTGQAVLQPDDYAMYAYDSVNVVVAALQKLGSVGPGQLLLHDMVLVHVHSANGDARGFNAQSHEGIAVDDIYVASIHDNEFQPVRDEQLSASLPAIDQSLANCRK